MWVAEPPAAMPTPETAARVRERVQAVVAGKDLAALYDDKGLGRDVAALKGADPAAYLATVAILSKLKGFSKREFEHKVCSKALERFPAGRAPTADEVARAAVFLLSEDASQINGQTVSVNGGLSFGGW